MRRLEKMAFFRDVCEPVTRRQWNVLSEHNPLPGLLDKLNGHIIEYKVDVNRSWRPQLAIDNLHVVPLTGLWVALQRLVSLAAMERLRPGAVFPTEDAERECLPRLRFFYNELQLYSGLSHEEFLSMLTTQHRRVLQVEQTASKSEEWSLWKSLLDFGRAVTGAVGETLQSRRFLYRQLEWISPLREQIRRPLGCSLLALLFPRFSDAAPAPAPAPAGTSAPPPAPAPRDFVWVATLQDALDVAALYPHQSPSLNSELQTLKFHDKLPSKYNFLAHWMTASTVLAHEQVRYTFFLPCAALELPGDEYSWSLVLPLHVTRGTTRRAVEALVYFGTLQNLPAGSELPGLLGSLPIEDAPAPAQVQTGLERLRMVCDAPHESARAMTVRDMHESITRYARYRGESKQSCEWVERNKGALAKGVRVVNLHDAIKCSVDWGVLSEYTHPGPKDREKDKDKDKDKDPATVCTLYVSGVWRLDGGRALSTAPDETGRHSHPVYELEVFFGDSRRSSIPRAVRLENVKEHARFTVLSCWPVSVPVVTPG